MIGANTARHHQTPQTGLAQRFQALAGQHIDDGGLETGGEVTPRGLAFLARQHQYRGLEAGKAEIQIAGMQHWPRQFVAIGLAAFRQFFQRRATRVGESQQLRGLVERLAGGVVHGLAEELVAANAIHPHQLGVPP